jgi:phage protein D
MSNAPVIKEVVKPVKKAIAGKPKAQATATPRKQAETKAKDIDEVRRTAVASAAEKSAALRARRGSRGMRSLLARGEGRLFGAGGQLARALSGID